MSMKKPRFIPKKTAPANIWEAAFGKIITPFEEFVHGETNSGFLLIICTFIALFIAHSPLYGDYEQLLHAKWFFGTEGFSLKLSLHHLINDGLMALFFFLVGLEIKREILVGELSDLRQALLPLFAAVGGMLLPALFYIFINQGTPTLDGWGIPMATDIAFAVTILVLLGNRVPKALMAFLVALAIIDDIGAVIIIAAFYSDHINTPALMWTAGLFGLLIVLNLSGVREKLPYALLGMVLWVFMYHSGVHATIAGILTALTIPARPKYQPKLFIQRAGELLNCFQTFSEQERNILRNSHMAATLQALERGVKRTQTPLQSLEHAQHLPVHFIIIPLFALGNAAIPIDVGQLGNMVTYPVTLGIMVGLVLGKPLGIALLSWLAIKLRLSSLPSGVSFTHIIGVGFLAGIGFTMSIFISELAFYADKETLILAKTGILFASVIAAIIGYTFLALSDKKTQTKTSS